MGAPLLVVTAWYPAHGAGSPLDAAVAAGVRAAALAGADVTVVHLVPRQAPDAASAAAAPDLGDDAGSGPVTVRRVVVDGALAPGDPAGIDAVAAALAEGAADLLGAAAVVHAHAAVPVAAAVARVAPETARLVVGEHLPSAIPLLAAADDDAPAAAARAAVLARADVVLAPSDDLARRLARRFGVGDEGPRFEVLPYPAAPAALHTLATPPAASAAAAALPASRWLLVGPAAAAEPLVRALAADALAGAPTTLTVMDADGDEGPERLVALAGRLGVAERLVRVPARDVLALLASGAVDLAVGADPLAAADPALTAAFAAGIPAVLARAAGSEGLVDEVAATGAVRLVRPGAGVVVLLEAVADLRRAELAAREPGDVRAPRPSRHAALLPPWRTSPDGVARVLGKLYGETVTPPVTPRGPWPRVLLVDLTGGRRTEIGRLARWVVQMGGEPVVVTAAAPPPSAGVAGAVTIDLRPVERALARQRLQGVRRRLPRVARPGFDGALAAYRVLRRTPTLVAASLAGPLAPGTGPSPDVVAAVAATDAASTELAHRWTGGADVLPPDTDRLIARLIAATGPAAGSVTGSAAPSPTGSEGS